MNLTSLAFKSKEVRTRVSKRPTRFHQKEKASGFNLPHHFSVQFHMLLTYSYETSFRNFATELVYYIVKDGAVIDGRRIEGELNMTKIHSAVATVIQPNREYLHIISLENELSNAIAVDECYRQAVYGAVLQDDYAQLEDSIKAAVLETSPGEIIYRGYV